MACTVFILQTTLRPGGSIALHSADVVFTVTLPSIQGKRAWGFLCVFCYFLCVFGFFFKLTTYKFLQKVKQNTWVVCASRTVKEGILASWNRPCPKHSSKVLEDPACANSEPSALLDGEKVLGALTRTGRMMGASPTPGEGFAFQ